jgi:hypothetical protein
MHRANDVMLRLVASVARCRAHPRVLVEEPGEPLPVVQD